MISKETKTAIIAEYKINENLSSIVITEAEFPEVFGIIDRINERLANEARSKEETA